MADYDAIVIGSGAGGLAAAVALARAGDKVLVLEQHDVPGGWCHSFRLGGHQFSPGVHYVGELGPGGRLREIYEGLGVADRLTFLELNPDGYEHLIVGQERFDVPKGKDRLKDALTRRFPKEARGIAGYLDAVDRMVQELKEPPKGRFALLKFPVQAPMLTRWGLRSTDAFVSHFVSDPLLKAFLTLQAGDHGVGPKDAPAAVHASVQAHYFDGAWYPMGGGQALPKAFAATLRRAGGEIRLQTRVERILVRGGKAVGVRLADGSEVTATRIISNADPGVTYGKLMDAADVPAAVAKRLRKTEWSISSLSMFLAADIDADAMGLDSGNYWYSATPDVQAGYDVCLRTSFDDLDEFPGQFLTFTTRKDRSKAESVHTMESFVFVGYDAFKRWVSTRFGERPQDYVAMKEVLSQKMLRSMDRMVPGLSERVVFRDLATPLTNEHYCMSTRGNLYGTDKTRWQVGPFGWPLRTPIDGLWMCGASTVSHGVLGATVSGLFAAASAKGCRAEDLLKPEGKTMTMLPADDVSQWPADLRERIARRAHLSTGSLAPSSSESSEDDATAAPL